MTIHITDKYKIRPDQELVSLTNREKFRLMDSLLNAEDESRRGLEITFNLSNAGRRINNRIYNPRDQLIGAQNSSDEPILKDHKALADSIIGRFESIVYNRLDNEALRYFKNVNDFAQLLSAFEVGDYEKAYNILAKNNLLTDKSWMGVSELEATALIKDEGAIEKFMDGRFLDFSCSALPKKYICSHCQDDWMSDGMCEHVPGTIVDGKLVVSMIDGYAIKEGSVVVEPGNDLSRIRSFTLLDHAGHVIEVADEFNSFDENTEYITDSVANREVDMADNSIAGFDAEKLADALLPLLVEKLKAVTPVEDKVEEPVEPVVEDKTTEDVPTVEDEQTEVADEPKVLDARLVKAVASIQKVTLGDSFNEDTESFLFEDQKLVPLADGAHIDAAIAALGCIFDAADEVTELHTRLEDAKSALETQTAEQKLEALTNDYTAAMKQLQDALAKIAELEEKVLAADEKNVSKPESELDNPELTTENKVEDTKDDGAPVANEIPRVTNDSVGSSQDDPNNESKLKGYQKSVVQRYKAIYDAQGKPAAEHFLSIKKYRRELPSDFDITPYITEEN